MRKQVETILPGLVALIVEKGAFTASARRVYLPETASSVLVVVVLGESFFFPTALDVEAPGLLKFLLLYRQYPEELE